MAAVLNMQQLPTEHPELPDEAKLSTNSWMTCAGLTSFRSQVFCT